MELPKLQKPDKYVGLYIFDFGDHTGVGFTAEEVAELLESERFRDGKVYRIHRALPDGTLELKGIPAQTFQLESGMFFYCRDLETAKSDFSKLGDLAVSDSPPCRAKIHLAAHPDDRFVLALIYPAEYDEQVSSWLLNADFRTAGAAEGGVNAVQRYYDADAEILDRRQLFGRSEQISRTGAELLAATKVAMQR